jgi:hypothetical protein
MKKLIRKILKEEMYINDKGELIDDSEHQLNIGDEVKVIIYVGNYDFVFPGHYGYVSVTGIDNHGDYEGVVIEEDLYDGDIEHLHMKGYLDWNEDHDIWNFYPYYKKEKKEKVKSPSLHDKKIEYVITFGDDDNNMPQWMNRLGKWVDVDDETFEEGEDVYNSWEEWIESPYFHQDGGLNRSSGEEGDWVKISALHSTEWGENYMKSFLKNGPMRVKRYKK